MNHKSEFWYHLIQGTLDDKTGVFGNFYTYGTHCGTALAKSVEIAEQEGIQNASLIETCRLDNLEEFDIPEDAQQMTSEVYMLPALSTYEINAEEYDFVPPTGIAFDTDEGEYETELIKEAFVAYAKNDNGIFELELVAGQNKLISTFFNTIDFLPTVDGFWLYILGHWDDSKTELWAGKAITNKEETIEFLTNNKASTLENGFVDLVVHSKKGETNLTLTEHKKIQLHTKDETVFQAFIEQVVELGFEQTRDYYNIEFGYHHWHYCPATSLDKIELIEKLQELDFESIELETENGLQQ